MRRVLGKPTWKSICHAWGWRCAYCGVQTAELHAEHVDAVSAGGSPEIDNVVPACRSCNGSKSDNTLLRWLIGATAEKPPQHEQDLAFPSVTVSDPLTLEEAAELASLSPVTLRVQIRNKRLIGAVKRGGVWFVSRKALDAYLAKVKRAAPRSGPRPPQED